MTQLSSSPTLAAPGKGLPLVESLVARYVLFPYTTSRLSQTKAIDMVCEYGQRALAVGRALPLKQLTTPVLIQRFPGIEDSSRHWSVLMTLEHLRITGESMARIVEQLVRQEPIEEVVRIEAVKPGHHLLAEPVFSAYETFLSGYRQRMESLQLMRKAGKSHHHPWFGEITDHQWLCLNALHHRIHWTQIQKILQTAGWQIKDKPGEGI